MFIGSIKGLNKHSTAREGNYMGPLALGALPCFALLCLVALPRFHTRLFISGMVATALGILSVLLSPGFHSAHIRLSAAQTLRKLQRTADALRPDVSGFFLTFLAAGGVGYGIASTVKMEDMPQLAAWPIERMQVILL